MRSVTRVIKPKHKPMTYVEQLQKLNEGTHKPRSKFVKKFFSILEITRHIKQQVFIHAVMVFRIIIFGLIII